ncbi:MAG TPA: strawberry notch C-terminal domain-containing protein, partial [Adhaeribacter sp.]|nr:strawberry notch C-terminal domain-containing protein [Adhaeribacter sp.]
ALGVAGISISPIDVLAQRIRKAGYSVAEITGRKYELQVNEATMEGLVLNRKKENVSDAFRKFNNNQVDVLLLNQSGSTGASAHAIVTDKVPANQVKQRVMIVLQPELDINTEIQKRGRINRTGQIIKPAYDYVSSAIPAEKRLMMMLQKKLKSLDANTSSNQKQSEATINIADDFLNKYGDALMDDYLAENPDLERLLDDPLNRNDDGKATVTEGAAQKVTGRVAVLSTAMQEAFYQEISTRFMDQVEYLKQTGEYDLEMEEMPLEAETISSKVVISGKGGASAFGQDTVLEKCRVNALRKPFSREDLDNMLTEALAGSDPESLSKELANDLQQFLVAKANTEADGIKAKAHIETDKEYSHKRWDKLKSSDYAAFEEAVSAKQAEIMETAQGKIDKIRDKASDQWIYLSNLFKFFTVGRGIKMVGNGINSGAPLAVCLGIQVDRKKPNPWAPSNVKVRFAVASSLKYMVIPASMNKELMAIKGASYGSYETNNVVANWSSLCAKASADRTVRYIVTGNILQGIAGFKGKLIDYTLLGG